MRHALSFPRHIREAVRAHVQQAIEGVSPDRFHQEPAYTVALLSRLEGVAYEGADGSVVFRATNIDSIGPGSAERWSGADFAITADISRGDLRVAKAILAQAKLGELPSLPEGERGRLVAQIQDMRRLTRSPKVLLVREIDGRRQPLIANVRTITDLQYLIAQYASADVFVASVLNYRHTERAETLRGVVNWLATVSGQGTLAEQLSNVQHWANAAHPRDYVSLHIRGLGLAGFQYLRMLFGANTTKPDIHICRFVAACVGHQVSDIDALQLLEQAAAEAGISLRDLDTTIWEASARDNAV